ncbi:MAG: ABC transporter ATP-binding protein [Verrucomicrobiota bacterium]
MVDSAPAADATRPPPAGEAIIEARGLTLAYGSNVVMRDLRFRVLSGQIFVIMGLSGSGKSTLLRHLIGLQKPAAGEIFFKGTCVSGKYDEEHRLDMLRRIGVTFQQGALWSDLTLLENVTLPMEEYTSLNARECAELARAKLALVGLAGFEDYYPADLSGGMRKRAGLARAMALDPEVLFFDEPSAGLDPLSSRRLDDLILQLRDSLGATIIIVTHELDSIFAIGDDSIFLDVDAKTITAQGNPRELRDATEDSKVRRFLRRDTR